MTAAVGPSSALGVDTSIAAEAAASSTPRPTFDEVYEAYFDFVWRAAHRLGVFEDALEDIVQDIFVVVHRRLPEFEARSTVKTWLYGITVLTVRDHRRKRARAATWRTQPDAPDPETLADAPETGPHDRATRAEAVRVLQEILEELDEEKREVFILCELEQLTVPQVAEALAVNVNTVYSRLRAARREFEAIAARRRLYDGWRAR